MTNITEVQLSILEGQAKMFVKANSQAVEAGKLAAKMQNLQNNREGIKYLVIGCADARVPEENLAMIAEHINETVFYMTAAEAMTDDDIREVLGMYSNLEKVIVLDHGPACGGRGAVGKVAKGQGSGLTAELQELGGCALAIEHDNAEGLASRILDIAETMSMSLTTEAYSVNHLTGEVSNRDGVVSKPKSYTVPEYFATGQNPTYFFWTPNADLSGIEMVADTELDAVDKIFQANGAGKMALATPQYGFLHALNGDASFADTATFIMACHVSREAYLRVTFERLIANDSAYKQFMGPHDGGVKAETFICLYNDAGKVEKVYSVTLSQ